MITLENESLLIGFHRLSGSVVRFFDKQKQLDFLAAAGAGGESVDSIPNPFRLEKEAGWQTEYHCFSYEWLEQAPGVQGIRLCWDITDSIQLIANIILEDRENQVSFYTEVINLSNETVISVEYPIIPSLQSITKNGENDYLVHSFATGYLIRNPIRHFEKREDGLRYMPYPEGFSGCTMQFFAYYGEGIGGIYFAVYDGEHHAKWLNCYKGTGDTMEASFIHSYEQIEPGRGITTGYPVVLKPMQEGSWYEAATLYKEWAIRQRWCANGPLWDRTAEQKSVWLLEDVGLATFGLNAMHDRSAWIRAYQSEIQTRIFHILGPDWPKMEQNFYNSVPGGLEDWFPARFHAKTMEAIREGGDRFAPFEFDYLFGKNKTEWAEAEQSLQRFPERIHSIDTYKFTLLCPACEFTRNLHIRRDARLAAEHAIDALYYDISANNILKVCMNEAHGHGAGAGKAIADAYHDNYFLTKQAACDAAGKYVPMGTEMINEIYLDVLDFYQARAGAAPAAPLEGWNIRDLLKSGAVELIPLFTFVYHEYGGVRLDGWGKLVDEIGDLFYFTVARTYLWGGLYELNYEYSPVECLDDGKENDPEEHYYNFKPRGYAFAKARAHYISQFASLRTGAGKRYLGEGKMLPPLAYKACTLTLNWYHYNCDINFKEYEDSGEIEVSGILHSAWGYRDESLAFFFANVTDEEKKVQVRVKLSDYLNQGKAFTIYMIAERESRNPLLDLHIAEEADIEVTVPAKRVIMLEALSN